MTLPGGPFDKWLRPSRCSGSMRGALLIVALTAACANETRDAGDRVVEKVHPKIITSEPPPKIEPKRPPLEPEPPPRIVERAPPPEAKEFYDYPEGYDKEYDVDGAQRSNDALDLIMGSTMNPFGKHGAGATELDNPPNTPPPREPQEPLAKAMEAPAPRVVGRISCEPRLAMRKAPSENANAVARLPVGTKVKVVSRGTKGEAQDWIQVDAAGHRGWVRDDATSELSFNAEGASYLECCGIPREAADKASDVRERFLERVDNVSCLSQAVTSYGGTHAGAELVLAKAIALERAGEMVQRSDKMPEPYKGFMVRYGGQLDWDPEGYSVRAGDMWTAEERYRGEPAAENIAWTAAHFAAKPRTCGREIICAVTQVRSTYGEYLARYPNGPHAQEALDAIAQLRPRGESDDRLTVDRNVERVEQCLATLDKLTQIVNASQSSGRTQALGALEGLRRFVLARSGHVQTKR